MSLPRACHHWTSMRLIPLTFQQVVLSPSVWLLFSLDRTQLVRSTCSPPCRFSGHPAHGLPWPQASRGAQTSPAAGERTGVGWGAVALVWAWGIVYFSRRRALTPAPWAGFLLRLGTLVFRVPHAPWPMPWKRGCSQHRSQRSPLPHIVSNIGEKGVTRHLPGHLHPVEAEKEGGGASMGQLAQ